VSAALDLGRRYRYALRVMMIGWLIGLSVFVLSWSKARRAVSSARASAQAIWAKPQEVTPASLPDRVRMALLALIESKYRPLGREPRVPLKQPPKKVRLLMSSPQSPQANLVRKFVQIGKPKQIYNFGILDAIQVRSDSPPVIVVSDDYWRWLVETVPHKRWSAEPGDDWWFVDPATGLVASIDLSDIESEMEWVNVSAMIALIFSLPWLWYFLLNQLDEKSKAG
jgi:hypothetical protein